MPVPAAFLGFAAERIFSFVPDGRGLFGWVCANSSLVMSRSGVRIPRKRCMCSVLERRSGPWENRRVYAVSEVEFSSTCRVSQSPQTGERIGSEAKCRAQFLGVSIATSRAGCVAMRCSTSMKYVRGSTDARVQNPPFGSRLGPVFERGLAGTGSVAGLNETLNQSTNGREWHARWSSMSTLTTRWYVASGRSGSR